MDVESGLLGLNGIFALPKGQAFKGDPYFVFETIERILLNRLVAPLLCADHC